MLIGMTYTDSHSDPRDSERPHHPDNERAAFMRLRRAEDCARAKEIDPEFVPEYVARRSA